MIRSAFTRRSAATLAVILCFAGCVRPHALSDPGHARSSEPVRFEAAGRIDQGGRRLRFEVAGAWRPPGDLRVEIRGPVGGVKALLLVHAGAVLVLFPAERTYMEMAATTDAWERLLGVPLTTDEIGTLFSPDGGERAAAMNERLGGAHWRIEWEGGIVRRSVTMTSTEAREDLLKRIEWKILRMEPAAVGMIPDSIFEVAVPQGWIAIDPAAGGRKPALLP